MSIFLLMAGGGALADPPVVSRVSAPLVVPSSAWGYYGTGTTHTAGDAAWPSLPPDMTALAHQLGAGQVSSTQYTQNVFSYVRNNIEVEFKFGLGKGGRGALIDQSGTPFDQAELMVKLLRQGGVTANYQIGTIALSAQQFGHWTGLVRDLVPPTGPVNPYSAFQTFNVDAQAACQFLADGGIPATINGASSCSGLAGNLSGTTPVVMAHVWVVVGGVIYDPSFKLHVLVPRMNLPSLMGCGTWGASTCASAVGNYLSGSTNTTFAGATAITNINPANSASVAATLNAQGVALQHGIESVDRATPAVNVVGGSTLYSVPASTVGLAPSSYTTQGAAWTGDVPDQYRTTFQVDGPGRGCLFYADELAGRRLVFNGRGNNGASAVTTIALDNAVGAGCPHYGTPGSGVAGHFIITVMHPYAANGGTYADDIVDFAMPEQNAQAPQFSSGPYPNPGPNQETSITGSYPVTIVHGFGDGSQSTEQFVDALESAQPIPLDSSCQPSTSANVISMTCHTGGGPAVAEAIRTNDTLLTHIISGVTQTATIRHHDVGILYASRAPGNTYMTLQSAVSIDNTRSDDPSARDRALEIASRLLPGLETNSTSAPLSGATPPFAGPNIYGPLVLVAPSQMAAVLAAFPASTSTFETDRRAKLLAAAAAGYTVVLQVPQSGSDLYPGEFFFKTDRRAYTLWGALKGATIGDPAAAVMKAAQVSDAASGRKKYASVSPATGDLTFTPAPDIVTGSGDFPTSLPFVRTYTGGASELQVTESTTTLGSTGNLETSPYAIWHYDGPDQTATTRLGGGWTDNYNVTMTLSGDIGRSLGSQSGSEASYAISTVVTMNELAQPSTLQDWAKLMFLNGQFFFLPTFIVRKGGSTEGFVQLQDGAINPPPGSKARFATTWPSTATFTYTGGGGDQIYFDKLSYSPSPGGSCIPPPPPATTSTPLAASYAPSTWTFPDGVVVTFDYQSLPFWTSVPQAVFPACLSSSGNILSGVHNNLGRSLTIASQPYYLPTPLSGCSNIYCGTYNAPIGYKITSVTDENGRSVAFTSPCSTLLCSSLTVTDPMSQATRYEYTPDANSPDPSVFVREEYRIRRWFTPDNSATPFQIFTYDDLFRVAKVTDILSHATLYSPGGVFGTDFWKSASETDPLGNTTASIYDQFNNGLSVTDPLGRITTKTFDFANRVVTVTEPEGNYSVNTYDVRSNVLSTVQYPKPGSPEAIAGKTLTASSTYLEGSAVFFCANQVTCNEPATTTDLRGNVTSYGWNSSTGLLTQVKSGLNGSLGCGLASGPCPETDASYTGFTGTDGGQIYLLTSVDKKIDSTHDVVTLYNYNTANKLVLQKMIADYGGGHLNHTTLYTFDAIGNLTAVDGPRTDVSDDSHFVWDADRQLTMAIRPDPDGVGTGNPRPATRYVYDPDGQPVETDTGTTTATDGTAFTSLLAVTTAYDAAGNKIRDTTPTAVTQYSYDADDQLLCTAVRMNPAVFGSLPSDACTPGTTSTTYGPDRITWNIIDAAGQLRQVVRGYTTAAQQVYSTAKFSANGKPVAVADADAGIGIGVAYADALNATAATSHQTNTAYDGFDRPLTTTYADGTHEDLTYDVSGVLCAGGGLPCTRTNRSGQMFTLVYDSLDRVKSRTVPAAEGGLYGHTVATTYDLLNRPLSVTDTAGATTLSTIANVYDPLGRLTSSARTTSELNAKTVLYQYDPANNRTRLTWPDGYYVTYSYDALNNPATVIDSDGTQLAGYSYDPLGRRSGIQYDGTSGASIAYSWSPESDLTSLTNNFAAAANDVTFTNSFSPAHQWVSSTISNSAYEYAPAAASPITYTPTGLNQYGDISGGTILYDTRGNYRHLAVNPAFTYDAENQLRTGNAAGTIVYPYDGVGRRTSRVVSGVTTSFLQAGDSEIAEYSGGGSGTLVRRFVPGPTVDEYIAMVTCAGTGCSTPTKTFFHTDKMGSVIAMSDMSGNLVEGPYIYDPYGRCTIASGAGCTTQAQTTVPFRFTGQRLEWDNGLSYYRARFYFPTIGRFLQTDPVGPKDDLNLYAYVGNDPANKSDPTGMDGAAAYGAFAYRERETYGENPPFDSELEDFANNVEGLGESAAGIEFEAFPIMGAMLKESAAYLRAFAAVMRAAREAEPFVFFIEDAQFGSKAAKHAADFGLNPRSAADRAALREIIENIAREPDRVVNGTFAGQGAGNTRGAVKFLIKGSDVVVTKPSGTFVTVLKGGISNPSVQDALKKAIRRDPMVP